MTRRSAPITGQQSCRWTASLYVPGLTARHPGNDQMVDPSAPRHTLLSVLRDTGQRAFFAAHNQLSSWVIDLNTPRQVATRYSSATYRIILFIPTVTPMTTGQPITTQRALVAPFHTQHMDCTCLQYFDLEVRVILIHRPGLNQTSSWFVCKARAP